MNHQHLAGRKVRLVEPDPAAHLHDLEGRRRHLPAIVVRVVHSDIVATDLSRGLQLERPRGPFFQVLVIDVVPVVLGLVTVRHL